MIRSSLSAFALMCIVAACNTSPTPVVAADSPASAGVASGAPAAATAPTAPSAATPVVASAAPADAGPDDQSDAQKGIDAKYRACSADADCVTVEPVGCCHNGRQVSVAASQKAAYLASFTCPQARPICPMYRLRPDGRVAGCASGLCVMKTP